MYHTHTSVVRFSTKNFCIKCKSYEGRIFLLYYYYYVSYRVNKAAFVMVLVCLFLFPKRDIIIFLLFKTEPVMKHSLIVWLIRIILYYF